MHSYQEPKSPYMKAKVVTSMVRWFILRFMRIGKFPQIKSQHTLAKNRKVRLA